MLVLFLTDPAVLSFGSGSGEIQLMSVNCDGSESLLLDCNADTDTSDCSHPEDAGVSCLSGKML